MVGVAAGVGVSRQNMSTLLRRINVTAYDYVGLSHQYFAREGEACKYYPTMLNLGCYESVPGIAKVIGKPPGHVRKPFRTSTSSSWLLFSRLFTARLVACVCVSVCVSVCVCVYLVVGVLASVQTSASRQAAPSSCPVSVCYNVLARSTRASSMPPSPRLPARAISAWATRWNLGVGSVCLERIGSYPFLTPSSYAQRR